MDNEQSNDHERTTTASALETSGGLHDEVLSNRTQGNDADEPNYAKIAQEFLEAVEGGDLDVYQMCAWACMQDNLPKFDRAMYYGKALVCVTIQIVGLILFLYVEIDPLLADTSNLCYMRSGDDEDYYEEIQALSVMFAFYISFRTGGAIFDISRSGLYTMNMWTGEDCPPFVSRGWVFLGIYTNVFASLGSIIGSFVVLYEATAILDIILHSVALFFITDIDDFVLNKKDYIKITQWKCGYEKRQSELMDTVKSIEHPPLGKVSSFFVGKVMTPITYAGSGVCVGIALLAPIWIAICH